MASSKTYTLIGDLSNTYRNGKWEGWTQILDPSADSYNLDRDLRVAFKIELPAEAIRITAVKVQFRLTPSTTPPTERNLKIALYSDDPTDYVGATPIAETSDPTVYTDVRYPNITFSNKSIPGNEAYIVVSEYTTPATSYYKLDQITGTITADAVSAPSVTAQAPKNQTMQGDSVIRFSWSFSGDGTIDKSIIDWSTDNSHWSTLSDNISGTYTDVSAMVLPRGDVYWRVKSKSSYGIWSDYAYARFTVAYAAQSQIVPVNSPTSGFVPAGMDVTFSAAMDASGPVNPPFSISAASFFWRSGYSGDYNQVAMIVAADGSTASTTITAGVFPEGQISWYLSGTDDTGRTTETEVYAITVLNADVVASAISPSGVVVNAANEISFTWSYQSLDGSAQTGATLEYSVDGTTWLPLGSVSDASTSYTAAAGTLPGGTVWWRVKATSSGGDESPWSSPVSFIVLGAPTVSAVTGDGKPFLTITWQTSGQVSYKIKIDDTVYGPYYGPTVRSYSTRLPLSSGLHEVAVAVQNQQGLWSAWTWATVSVAENLIPKMTLYIVAAKSYSLVWTNARPQTGGYGYFLILRDGAVIAKTTATNYTDRTALGEHAYRIIQVLANGQYAESNKVTGTASVNYPMIGLVSGGDFLSLCQSEIEDRAQTVTRSAQVVYTYLSGGRFPVAEIGETEDLTVSGDVSWLHQDAETAAAFEAMLKKSVIYKTPGGLCVVGILQGYERTDPRWWKTYRFTIQQMDFEDYFDETAEA